jgi:hypothetical protein
VTEAFDCQPESGRRTWKARLTVRRALVPVIVAVTLLVAGAVLVDDRQPVLQLPADRQFVMGGVAGVTF